MLTFHVITLFPESLESYLGASIVKRAQDKKMVSVKYYNPRDFTSPRRSSKGAKAGRLSYADRRVDDRPYGGGPGMVMEALPVIKAVEAAIGARRKKHEAGRSRTAPKLKGQSPQSKVKIIFFTPSGKPFTNAVADSYKRYADIVLVCGRYEGIDARVKKAFPMVDVSVGPYTLTGGELPAMIVIDSITRRIPGALGHDSSVEESRVASPDVYTRPESFEFRGKTHRVPKILLSGHHAKMDAWKKGRKAK